MHKLLLMICLLGTAAVHAQDTEFPVRGALLENNAEIGALRIVINDQNEIFLIIGENAIQGELDSLFTNYSFSDYVVSDSLRKFTIKADGLYFIQDGELPQYYDFDLEIKGKKQGDNFVLKQELSTDTDDFEELKKYEKIEGYAAVFKCPLTRKSYKNPNDCKRECNSECEVFRYNY